ncbi:MAG: glycosyl hydrolase [Planctomycetota bacterium]|nr:glycosyl hydrolase [Planctomycetota bacterium]
MATTSNRLLIGTRKGLLEVTRGDGGWSLGEMQLPGQPIAYACRDPRNGSIWASIDHGHWGVKLSRSTDDGATFEEVEPPKYPEHTGKTARYYWVLEPGHADTPERFYVGTEPGGLFVTNDDGKTWQLDEALWALCTEHKWMGGGRDNAGVHSICIDPRDPNHVYVAVSCASVLETTDGGATWAYRSEGMRNDYAPEGTESKPYGHDPHFIAMAPSNPDVLWQQNHFGVFRSTNGAASWDDLTQPPLVNFGFPVAAHPTREETAWIIPMDSDSKRVAIDGSLCVMRTDDGGSTWAEQREGLPQKGTWDFPLRHCLDVGTDGETLAFATTSGNLYVSEDGGGSWACLTNNLPMVYSVRFA